MDQVAQDLARRFERLVLIHRISRELNAAVDAGALLPRVLESALKAVDAEAGSVWLLRGDKIVCEHSSGGAGERLLGLELPRGAGIVGSVAERGQLEVIYDAAQDPRFVKQVDEATGFQTRSMITVPMAARGEPLGALQVLNKRGDGKFTLSDVELIREIAMDAAAAVKNAMLLQSERRVRELRTLLRMSREITSTLDLDRILATAANILSGTVPFDRCALALERGGDAVLAAVSGKEKVVPEDPELAPLRTLLSWARGFNETIYSPWPDALEGDPKKVERLKAHAGATGMSSVLVVPLKDDQGRLGLLTMEAKREDFLDEGQRELVETFANQVAVALRNADLYRQTPLVGFLARRGGGGALGASPAHRRRLLAAGVVAGGLALLSLLRWPGGLGGDAVVHPARRHFLRAEVQVLVEHVDVHEGEAVRKGQVLGALRNADLLVTVAEAEARARGAQGELAQAAASADAGRLRFAEANLAHLEAARDRVRRLLEDCTLRAPADGFVLTHRPNEKEGKLTVPGEAILEIGEAGRWIVETRIDQRDVASVRAGDTLVFGTPAVPGRTFEGRIVALSAAGQHDRDAGTTSYAASAEVADPEGLLRGGMQGRGRVRGAGRSIGHEAWLWLRRALGI